ncbi:MAG: 4-hydroxythreonine-4-phosphate dehydrogenase PdxA [Hyphomicrobiaceae bacterium]
MQKVDRGILAVTSGDPAGIGLELTIKAWVDRVSNEIPPFVLFADANEMSARVQVVGAAAPVARVATLAEAANVFSRAVPVFHVAQAIAADVGKPNARNGAAIIAAIEQATAAVLAGEATALVTNPIAKSVLYEAGFTHPGHTEFLAAIAERARPDEPHTPVMLLACDELRVVPLTIHVALAAVPGLITEALIIETVRITHAGLKLDFGFDRPRIAVAGLNPHAGEGGAIGREDVTIIAPAIAKLRAEGLDVTGPHSADTLFHAQARRRYDAVVAMYHDQALIPIKTLAFDHGVNMTLGLPFVRTSPDHGTAFDIAGKGTARPYSLIEAMKLARAAANRRAKATP